ncbi:hypothetical protein SAMN06296241_1376 [Salinimicrobium sediminis]|uniref:Uncharacterized protein n=1 Tax=Salinimicrobium sediminis TaxID=1343891 RepID=A0A285X3H7_9FLAO|nr:hypothetical protein [Salinimicrobium sediminis]SOC79838.1 hypothetical protein SAMN06296241_1376 [Salinimicrobium sediminis]
MTKTQESFAEDLISFLRKWGGMALYHETRELRVDVQRHDRSLAVELLKDYGLIEVYQNQGLRLTKEGWEFPGFKEYRNDLEKRRSREDLIQDLTMTQLRKEIFHLKNWWWIGLINLLVSGFIAFLVAKYTT